MIHIFFVMRNNKRKTVLWEIIKCTGWNTISLSWKYTYILGAPTVPPSHPKEPYFFYNYLINNLWKAQICLVVFRVSQEILIVKWHNLKWLTAFHSPIFSSTSRNYFMSCQEVSIRFSPFQTQSNKLVICTRKRICD